MTVRVALTVLLALAVAGVALPAVDEASSDASSRLAREEATRVREAVASLASSNDPAGPGGPAARRSLTVSLPGRGPGTAAVRTFALGGDGASADRDGPRSDVVVVRVAGGGRRTYRVPVDVRVVRDGAVAPDSVGLELDDGDRVVLRLVRRDGRPVVLASRGFTTEAAASGGHVTAVPLR